MSYQWLDNLALGMAVLAVLLRLMDYPRASAITSTLTVLAATVGQWMSHRRRNEREELAEAARDRHWPGPSAVA